MDGENGKNGGWKEKVVSKVYSDNFLASDGGTGFFMRLKDCTNHSFENLRGMCLQ